MNLVTNHMLETLVIGWTQENHNLKLLASKTIVHHLVTVALVAQLMQLRAHIVNSLILEWRCITLVTIETSNLTQNTLDQVTDGHT